MNKPLSEAQQRVFNELQNFIAKQGFPPTVGELADKLKLTKATVQSTLDRLMQKGIIRRTQGKARSLEIVRSPTASVIDVVPVPLLGEVPAGIPIDQQESENGAVYVQSNIVGEHQCFALNVVGESMSGADIRNGDIVIVRQQRLAENGDIVVASVDGEVTVKRIAIGEGDVRLMPANREFNPIEINQDTDLKILGRVIATRRVANKKI